MLLFAIEKANYVLVIAHVDPDGDAIGSLTAMGQALVQLGKRVTLVADDSVPERFHYLPMAGEVRRAPLPDVTYDLVIAVDCGDEARMGWAYANLPEPRPAVANIDHHITNTHFGEFNMVDPEASSTAEVLYRLFKQLDITITPGIAESLLNGIVTDTLGFRTSNTSAETLRTAADLVDAGGQLADISLKALHRRPYATAQMWALGLGRMQLDDGLLWTCITLDEMRSSGVEGSPSSSGLVNFLSDVEEAAMGVVLSEMPDGTVRVGMRCHEPFNVAEVASQFGGGGHALAAGCTLDGPMEKAEAMIVNACQAAIRRQRHLAR